MKLAIAIALAASSLMTMPALAGADNKVATSEQKPDPIKIAAGAKVTATVVSVDLASRLVVLKGPQGNLFEIYADERVKNLPQLKAGDLVTAAYAEAVALEVKPAGSTLAKRSEKESLQTAKPGEKPGMISTTTQTVVAEVTRIDTKKQMTSLKTPEGKIIDVKAKNPDNLKKVKVGDMVEVTYTQALAVSVTAAPAAPAAK